jgi:hypothetical protein
MLRRRLKDNTFAFEDHSMKLSTGTTLVHNGTLVDGNGGPLRRLGLARALHYSFPTGEVAEKMAKAIIEAAPVTF